MAAGPTAAAPSITRCSCSDDPGQGVAQAGLVHQHDLVDDIPHDVERDGLRIEVPGQAVGDRGTNIHGYQSSRFETPRERTRRGDFDADHSRGRRERFDRDADAADQPAAPDGNDDRVEIGLLRDQFEADRAGSGDHIRM